MENTTFSDATQWLIEHYSDDKDRLNYDPSPDEMRKAYEQIGAEPPRDTRDYTGHAELSWEQRYQTFSPD